VTPFTHMIGRKPFCIGPEGDVYMRRWWIIPRTGLMNIYLHQFLRSDDDRALHDHPWLNISILLRGSYVEHTTEKATLRHAPAIVFRRATAAHRIELIDNKPVWTLFLTGPKIREWGFLCPQGWRHWKIFVDTREGGNAVGRGCE
jgi:hypothetical protein